MAKGLPTEAKVGIFVVITIMALAYLTIRINRAGLSFSHTKTLYVNFDTATGLLQRSS